MHPPLVFEPCCGSAGSQALLCSFFFSVSSSHTRIFTAIYYLTMARLGAPILRLYTIFRWSSLYPQVIICTTPVLYAKRD